jgi:hypothetical protein
MTVALARDLPLGPDVFGEGIFESALISIRAEAKASFDSAVADRPDGVFDDTARSVASGWLEPQAGTLPPLRHSSLIRSIAVSEV